MMELEGKLAQLRTDLEEARERANWDDKSVSHQEVLDPLRRTRDIITEGLEEFRIQMEKHEANHNEELPYA